MMNAHQRRKQRRQGGPIRLCGFVRMIADTLPEIYRVGQLVEIGPFDGERQLYVAIGSSWDTAEWVPARSDRDAMRKLAAFVSKYPEAK